MHVAETSTDKIPNSSPTAASASSDLYGAAILDACAHLNQRLEPVRAKLGKDATMSQVANEAWMQRIDLCSHGWYVTPDITGAHGDMPFNYFVYGAAVAEVEVDCLTGEWHNARTDIVMDVGNPINPSIDIGQVEGGFVQVRCDAALQSDARFSRSRKSSSIIVVAEPAQRLCMLCLSAKHRASLLACFLGVALYRTKFGKQCCLRCLRSAQWCVGVKVSACVQGMGWACLEELKWGDDEHPWIKPGLLLTSGAQLLKVALLWDAMKPPCRVASLSSMHAVFSSATHRGRGVNGTKVPDVRGMRPSVRCACYVAIAGPGNYKIPTAYDIPRDFRVKLLDNLPNARAVHSSKAVGEPPFHLGACTLFALKDAIASARADAGASSPSQPDACGMSNSPVTVVFEDLCTAALLAMGKAEQV